MSMPRVVVPAFHHHLRPAGRHRNDGGRSAVDRPAWQSPYGPPPRRSRRGRWARVPVTAIVRIPLRRGHVAGRAD
ncbi:hypothetical protein ACIRBY_33315 [Streptomyces sp. NPDC096136]|uniref:hypothetical protein n=1 Tax=Streptomyces sp. NPDC096136 TaxID=3366076 RepID=UPI00382BC839